MLSDFAEWLLDVLLFIPKQVWEWLLEAVAAMINAIPVPDWIQDVGAVFAAIPADVIWFLDPFRLGLGLSLIGTAYTIRFLIRRLPVVG